MTRDHLLTLYTIETGDKLPLNDSCGSEEDFCALDTSLQQIQVKLTLANVYINQVQQI